MHSKCRKKYADVIIGYCSLLYISHITNVLIADIIVLRHTKHCFWCLSKVWCCVLNVTVSHSKIKFWWQLKYNTVVSVSINGIWSEIWVDVTFKIFLAGRPKGAAGSPRKKAKDANKPKRSTSAYFFYLAHCREQASKAGRSISKVILSFC